MVELNGRYSKKANASRSDILVAVVARYAGEHQLSRQLQRIRRPLGSVDLERQSAPPLPPRPAFKLAQRLAPEVSAQLIADYEAGKAPMNSWSSTALAKDQWSRCCMSMVWRCGTKD
jgi:hypothetical protein